MRDLEDADSSDTLPSVAPGADPDPPILRNASTASELNQLDRYRVVALLGQGGYGKVYRAYDSKLKRFVALKVLNRRRRHDERSERRFRREAIAASALNHPNICAIYEIHEEGGRIALAMELIDGETLAARRRRKTPTIEETVDYALQIARGLEHAHSRGIAHRDIKTDNIMVSELGKITILDFGLAKWINPGPAEQGAELAMRLSAPGAPIGTLAYMAPEQVRAEEVGPYSDLFSLGVVLYELTTGRLPFAGRNSFEISTAIIQDEPPPLIRPEGDIPPLLEAIILRLLAKEPGDRYEDAIQVRHALEELTEASGPGRFDSGQAHRLSERRKKFEESGARSPYPGLIPFDIAESDFFFGRESEVVRLWERAKRQSFLAIVGPSGAGKSSFLRAGFLASRPSTWGYILMVPGHSPFSSLGRQLAREFSDDVDALQLLPDVSSVDTTLNLLQRWKERHSDVVLVVDQFEELFTLNTADTIARFSDVLMRASNDVGVRVLLSMRDDFVFECHAYPRLAGVFSGLVPLSAPAGVSLSRALIQPANRCGYRFEDQNLVEQMVAEVSGDRGALPLLAFAAGLMWKHRDRDLGALTRAAYLRIGGVAGALARHAEQALDQIGRPREPIVREIFRNLVSARGTRTSRTFDELMSVFSNQPQAEEVVNALINARLLTSYEVRTTDSDDAPERRLEIIHESLLSRWPRLVRWQTQDAEGATFREQLRQAAQLWDARGRPADLLWAGSAIGEYRVWRRNYGGGLSSVETAFAASMVDRDEKRQQRSRLAVTVGFVVLVTVCLLIGLFWRRASSEARRAESSYLSSLGRLVEAENPSEAVGYAIASLELHDSQAARELASRVLWNDLIASAVDHEPAWSVEFSPNGEWLARGGERGLLELWRSDGGRTVRLQGHRGTVMGVAFSEDSQTIISTAWDNTIRFWSVPDGAPIRSLEFEDYTRFELRDFLYTFTPQGERTLVRKWDLEGNQLAELGRLPLGAVGPADWDVDIAKSGQELAFGRDDTVMILTVGTDEFLTRSVIVGTHPSEVVRVAFEPHGNLLASADALGNIYIWALAAGDPTLVRALSGRPLVSDLAWSDDGAKLAAASTDQTVLLWELGSPTDAHPLELRRGAVDSVLDVSFDPSGRWLASADLRGLALWSLTRPRARRLTGHRESVFGLSFASDGSFLASASWDGSVRVWPLDGSNHEPSSIVYERDGELFHFVAIGPDDSFVVTGSNFGRVREIDLATGREVQYEGFNSQAWPIAVSSNGNWVAAGGGEFDPSEALIRIWNRTTAESRVLSTETRGKIRKIRFCDGDKLLAASDQDGLLLWDLQTATFERIREGQVWRFDATDDCRIAVSVGGSLSEGVGSLVSHDLLTGRSQLLDSHGSRVFASALARSGESVVSGTFEGVVQAGSLSGEPPHVLLGHERPINAVAIHPNGDWIASASADGTLRLWPTPTTSPSRSLGVDEFIGQIQGLSNYRVSPDATVSGGYRRHFHAFRGWNVAEHE